ncbi:hypothetical protein C8J56DRAFT_1038505 [Mycena floridula]|nr:hypothetical protein C8J56DRAFT_1038505 [Mycena floridula]
MMEPFQSLQRFFYIYAWNPPLAHFSPSDPKRCEIVRAQKELLKLCKRLTFGLSQFANPPYKSWQASQPCPANANLRYYLNLVLLVCFPMINILENQPLALSQPLGFYTEHIASLERFSVWASSDFRLDDPLDPMIINLAQIENSLSSIKLFKSELFRCHLSRLPACNPSPLALTSKIISELNVLVRELMKILVKAASGLDQSSSRLIDYYPVLIPDQIVAQQRRDSSSSTATLVNLDGSPDEQET